MIIDIKIRVDTMTEIEKIEVAKNNGNYFYTGKFTEFDDNWVLIKTIKGETLYFRKEQIMQRRTIRNDTRDTIGKQNKKECISS